VSAGHTGRYRWTPVPATSPPNLDSRAPVPVAPDSVLLVIGGAPAERDRLRAAITGTGRRAVTLDLGDGDADGLTDDALQAGVGAAIAAAGRIDGVVDLGLEVAPGAVFAPSAPGPWRAALRRTVAVLKHVYDDWAAEADANRLCYLVVTRIGGRMGYPAAEAGPDIAQPLGGIWAGLAKTLPQELPNCRVKVVDLPAGDDATPVVLRELGSWDLYEIGWSGGRRWTLAGNAQDAGAPRLALRAIDTVLLTGGGRGVGFELARELAARFGCRVLISGRHAPPGGDEEWAGLTDDEFERREREGYGSRPAGTGLREARAETVRRRARREVARNLARARREGLRVEYHVGDVTDPGFARAYLDAAGPGLRVVVHNAGIAAPTRLRGKSPASFVATVATKVDGFLALVTALEGRRVDYVCNVGSVSARIGGMVGQIDYAAANEALTRLGFWAQSRGVPVATLCWPTWQRLGLVANYDAALRYAAAMPVGDGVARWIDEIGAAEPGEVMFLGPIGRAVSPSQLKGLAKFRDHPDIPRLRTMHHYLGDVETFAPFRSLRSRTVLPAGTHPCLAEFRVAGAPALPVGVALEYLLSTGAWVVPEGWPDLWLREVRDVVVDLPGLAFDGGRLELVKTGNGRRAPDGWEVCLELSRSDGRTVARGVARYGDARPAVSGSASGTGENGRGQGFHAPGAAGGLEWAGTLYRQAVWAEAADGRLRATVAPVTAADEWTSPGPPGGVLPHAALENVLRLAVVRTAPPSRAWQLRIRSIGIGGAPPEPVPATVEASPDLADWRIAARSGTSAWTLTGLVVT
jgi:NAD(P)-dependent dehydrogenase (short-subunit alcohol dehydrogenase family)